MSCNKTDHEDESAAGELGTPIDSDREWDGFDVSPSLSFIDDVLTPLCRLKRLTMSWRKSRNSTAYNKNNVTNSLEILHSTVICQQYKTKSVVSW